MLGVLSEAEVLKTTFPVPVTGISRGVVVLPVVLPKMVLFEILGNEVKLSIAFTAVNLLSTYVLTAF